MINIINKLARKNEKKNVYNKTLKIDKVCFVVL